jgi:hypothetical protein
MMWADKIAISLLAAGLALIAGIGVFETSGNFFYHVGRAIGWFVGAAILIVLPLWLVLRIAGSRHGLAPRRRAPVLGKDPLELIMLQSWGDWLKCKFAWNGSKQRSSSVASPVKTLAIIPAVIPYEQRHNQSYARIRRIRQFSALFVFETIKSQP